MGARCGTGVTPVFRHGQDAYATCRGTPRGCPWVGHADAEGRHEAKLVQITIRAMGYDLRLRRSLRGKALPFRSRPFSYNLFSAAGRLSLPAAENENFSEISPGKAKML